MIDIKQNTCFLYEHKIQFYIFMSVRIYNFVPTVLQYFITNTHSYKQAWVS